MKIAFGHSNMDMDCLASLLLVKKLFPEYRLVQSRSIHPGAQNLFNFFSEIFGFLDPQAIAGEDVDSVIIVDTSNSQRVKEYFNYIDNPEPEILIYDHHPSEACDIYGAHLERRNYGANASFLGLLAQDRGIVLRSEEATIALAGLYQDTGHLTYENVVPEDFEAASYFLRNGASIKLVKSFIESIKNEAQHQMLHRLLRLGATEEILGHSLHFSYVELEENINGLAAVVEKIMSLENPDAYFAFFFYPKTKTMQLIARSQKIRIDLHRILTPYGGGGHQFAGSAKIPCTDGPELYAEFRRYLADTLVPATRVRDIMTKDVLTINENATLLEASLYMEKVDFTGLPVVRDNGELCGFLSLRDIMKGRKNARMEAPVRAFMTTKLVTSGGGETIREVERIFYRHHINHLPVVEEGKLTGILTRWDFLEFRKRQNSAERALGKE